MKNDENFNSIDKIRVIDFNSTDYLDTQAIYHAVAHAFEDGTPHTLTIMNPAQTYACIGFFQDLEKEIDIKFCSSNKIPVLRREVGGGAVLLDSDQLFFHYIFNRKNLSRDINKIYSIFLDPAVKTYNRLGLDVYHRPINDLQIGGRKIGGTGAVEIGNSMVVVGSFMFDFNYELMVRILKIPSEKFRDKVYQNVREYITNIKREFAYLNRAVPSREQVKKIFLEEVGKKFNAEILPADSLYGYELDELEKIRERLKDPEWLKRKGKFFDRKVKISADVNVYEGSFKGQGGLIRVTFTKKENKIIDIDLSGDFTMLPPEGLGHIEDSLSNIEIDYDLIIKKVTDCYEKYKIRSPGISPQDFGQTFCSILEKLK